MVPLVYALALDVLEKTGAELKTELLPHQKRVVERLREQPGLVGEAYRKNIPQEVNTEIILPRDLPEIAKKMKKAKEEFAPGIPLGRVVKNIPKVPLRGKNKEWGIAVQHHPADQRGDHFDLRLIDEKDRAHSWALPPELPQPGKSTYAIQQPTHTGEYSRQEEPFEIEKGYGRTRPGEPVKPVHLGATEVVEAGPQKVRFLRHRGSQTDEFVLRQIEGKTWALHNATKNTGTREGQKLPQYKRDFGAVSPEAIDYQNRDQVVTAKIDGAHAIVSLQGEGRYPRVYSYRQPKKSETGLIEYTYKLPDFQKRKSDPGLKGSVVRAEVWFADKETGRAVPVNEVASLLNSGVMKSRGRQAELGVVPRLSVTDIVRYKGRMVEGKPFAEKLPMMREVARKTRGMDLPPMAFTEQEKAKLVRKVESGELPQTREGLVLRSLSDPKDKPVKAVFRPDHDVYVKEIFQEKGKRQGLAGGFTYSTEPDGPAIGRVGTGFNHALKRDMAENPDKYVGRVAKVQSPMKFESGSLRAPAFKAWHPDKNTPETMEGKMKKTAASIGRVLPVLRETAVEQAPGVLLSQGKSQLQNKLQHNPTSSPTALPPPAEPPTADPVKMAKDWNLAAMLPEMSLPSAEDMTAVAEEVVEKTKPWRIYENALEMKKDLEEKKKTGSAAEIVLFSMAREFQKILRG